MDIPAIDFGGVRMMNLFTNPEMLFLAAVPFPAWIVSISRWKRFRSALRILENSRLSAGGSLVYSGRGSEEPESSEKSASRRFFIRSIMYSLAWFFLVAAAAGPRWGVSMVATRQEGSSVIFLMDISRSMTASDLSPDRLAYASRYASLLLQQMEGVSCGVVLSRGESVLAVPLTEDHQSISILFDSLSPVLLSAPGSSIAQGVKVAVDSFPSASSSSRTLIVLSDGDGTESEAAAAGAYARSAGVVLAVIGVGTEEGAYINVLPSAEEPRFENMTLGSGVLRSLADSGTPGSFYAAATDAGSAWRVLECVSSTGLPAPRLVQTEKTVNRSGFFILLSLVSFMLALIAGGRWCKK